ncbi:class II aldolase/adducin family protein [Saccharicrinis aurantiacus]|uniref:class II aldolase/adducin family protein n=1 Tax=Saccharicrinis aurantiacus TaxID=1849719 RepID=UPI0024915894|nr:class II aldolase/adducin family protein [Saccharicrinis aurantiacus]
MKNSINQLVEMSQKFGQDPQYIIAGGGNSSFKDNEKMWVKASGTSMATINENGFVCLDRNLMQVLSTKVYSENPTEREEQVKQDLHAAILFPEGKRPSVEASMHEVIPYSFVMHTHPTLVNGLLCALNSESEVKRIFGDEVVYVPYTDPGYVLYKEVLAALKLFKDKNKKDAQIIFLENHGVFVGANTCKEIDSIYNQIEEKLKQNLQSNNSTQKQNKSEELNALVIQLQKDLQSDSIVADSSSLIKRYVENTAAFEEISKPFTPDNIVYCKSKYLYLNKGGDVLSAFAVFFKTNGYYPKVIACEGLGIICVEDNLNSAKIVLDVFTDMVKICALTHSFGGPRPMSQNQIDFIDNWEVENYRRKISKETN